VEIFKRFLLTGILNTGVGFLLNLFLLYFLPFNYFICVAIASSIGILFNFYSYQKFTFKTKIAWNKFFKFFLWYFIIYIINVTAMAIIINLGVGRIFAFIFTFPMIVVITYVVQRYYIFKI